MFVVTRVLLVVVTVLPWPSSHPFSVCRGGMRCPGGRGGQCVGRATGRAGGPVGRCAGCTVGRSGPHPATTSLRYHTDVNDMRVVMMCVSVRIVVAVVVVAMRVVAVMHIVVTVVLVIMRAATVVYIVVTGALVVMRVVIAVHRWVCIVQVRRVDVCVSDITIQCVLVFGGVAGCADGASGVWSRSGSVLYGYVLLMCMPVGALAC